MYKRSIADLIICKPYKKFYDIINCSITYRPVQTPQPFSMAYAECTEYYATSGLLVNYTTMHHKTFEIC